MQDKTQIVIGGGSWGTAIAAALARANQKTRLLVRNQDNVQLLAEGKCRQLADMPAVAPLDATTDETCLKEANLIFVVVPVSATLATIDAIKHHANPEAGVIFCAKGLISEGTHKGQLLSEVAQKTLAGFATGILSGPSFADEVLKGLPAALVFAGSEQTLIDDVQGAFKNSNLRLYGNDDPVGVAVGGAMKNVIAIASGCAVGLGLGDNAKAAIVTRGVAEMARFAVAVGGRAETIYGLAGVGDLALSCAGPHSRNMAYGLAIGSGETPDKKLAEGRHTVAALAARAADMGLDLPITNAVDRVVNHGDNLPDVVAALLARHSRTE